ncbi:MAG: ATP-binding protein [Sphingomicrobium sp.]
MGYEDRSVSRLTSAQFVAAMEHSPIGTAIVGLSGQWLWTNIAIRDIFGYTKNELERLTFQDITHPDDLALDLDHVRALLEGHGTAYQMEKRYLHRDGHHVWCLLSVSIVRSDDGAPEYFISKVQDISQRKSDEIERATLTERLMLATRAGGVGVWEWEIASGTLIWDARMFELYGIDPAVAPDYATFLHAVDPAHCERIDALLQGAVAGTATYDTEYPIALPDGEIRQLRALATVHRDSAGVPVRMVGTNWDVTEHLRLVQLAEQAARSKSEFLATISHELRTPLNSIIGFSHLVLTADAPREEEPLPPTARRYIELVRDASTTLLTVVDDVLDFSRIEAGGFELSPGPFRLRSMTDSAIEIVRTVAEAKGLVLVTEIAGDIPDDLVGDANRLRQVLLNLLGNAIKFTAHGNIRVIVDILDGAIRWQVIDGGIGIAADKQHLLFKRFSQVDQSIARRFGGSGLGLAICDRLVSAMGGGIGVDSEPGIGSRFWFRIPLPQARPVAPPLRLASQPASTNRRILPSRILLAEDVELNQMLAVALLKRAGHSVVVVSDGAEALARVQTEHFDLILMDVQMPVMDGVEATNHIRALGGRYVQLPIIALTANVLPDEIARFRAAGMNDHVGKPIAVDVLQQMIERWGASANIEAVRHR